MTQQLILTRGVPASGKTTWAEKHVKDNPQFVNVNRDDLRSMLFGRPYKFTSAREEQVSRAQFAAAESAITDGKSVIVSDTNINPKTVERWKEFARFIRDEYGVTLRWSIKDFYIDLDEALERNALRDGGVPPSVVYRMYYQYVPQVFPDWKVEHDEDLTPAIIVDVDGTLADHEGIRSPYDATKVKDDRPHPDIIDLVRRFHVDHRIIIMTGRDGSALNDTKYWLEDKGVPYDEIYIRAEGDTRKDSIIKKELFDKHVRGKYNVKYVIDDRLQVIYMWRALGLRVLDVAGGWF